MNERGRSAIESLEVLAVEPYDTGSHRQFLDAVVRHSSHRWTVLRGPGVHWKWRMRSSPLEMAAKAKAYLTAGGRPDAVVCSDMLDLAQWRGIVRCPELSRTPSAVYFHENQWTYPKSPNARVDHHYGYTNLVTALAADACFFNSAFHRSEFLAASRAFVGRMPDARSPHDIEGLSDRCEVIPPGFDPPGELPPRAAASETLRIGWVHRWEYDKRPDRFLKLLEMLDRAGVPFSLILLGTRPRRGCQPLESIRGQFGGRLLHDGYAASRDEYWRWLRCADVVVSTADHEFFGIAICEGVWAGAAPVLPSTLSYPELFPENTLYVQLDSAVDLVRSLISRERRGHVAAAARASIEPVLASRCVRSLDRAISRLVDRC